MSNSKLVNYTKLSPNYSSREGTKIKKITIHHMAGNLSVETCGNVFQSRKASSNYGVGTDGRVGLYVNESNRAWTSSNKNNDIQAVTIEVANDGGAPDWHVSDKALNKTIDLVVDICKRNGIKELKYTGDATGTLTRHNMFTATLCPGPYLQSKFPYIAEEVNKRLKGETSSSTTSDILYKVQVGAYTVKSNADKQAGKLKELGYNTYTVLINNLYKVQVGAFRVKANADKLASELKAKGFSTYITTENVPGKTVGKTDEQIAREVIKGLWGNGQERKYRLTAAGYNYNIIQDLVNKML